MVGVLRSLFDAGFLWEATYSVRSDETKGETAAFGAQGRRGVEAVTRWFAKTAVEPEIWDASALAATLLRKALETCRAELQIEQGMFWDDLEDVA